MTEEVRHLLQTLMDVQLFQHPLSLLRGNVDIGGDEIGQSGGLRHVLHCRGELFGQRLRHLHDPFEGSDSVTNRRLDLQVDLDLVLQPLNPSAHPRL